MGSNPPPSHQRTPHRIDMFRLFKKFFRRRRLPRPQERQATPINDMPELRNDRRDSQAPSSIYTIVGTEESKLPEKYLDLALQLRRTLPSTCSWLGEKDLGIDEGRPVIGGRFADVWKGLLDGRVVAIKSYRCYVCFDCDSVRMRFYREAHAYSLLSHRNIVPFVGVYSTLNHPFALVFDSLTKHLNLTEYLRNEPNASRLQLVTGIARGLQHMHDLGVVHGNLESTNILVDAEGAPRIAGLGSAFVESSPAAWSEPPLELTRCSAPELFNHGAFGLQNARNTRETDMYAFGVLACEIFAGNRVFPGLPDPAAMFTMLDGARPPRPHDAELSDKIWDMINDCWANTPLRRPTIAEAVSVLETELNGPPSHLPLLSRQAQ